MCRQRNKKNLLFSIVLLLVLVIGIGYAYLTSNLSISGTTEIAANSWNIHFENLNVSEGSITAFTPATIQSNNVDITYSIRLERPKDYYEFTVDIKNDGTLPGKVSISTLSGITSSAEPVVDYSITYTNGNPVQVNDILNAGAKKTIKVRVFYKDDISSTDLPSSNINLILTYTLQYIQSDESEFDTDALINQLKTESSSCFTKYEGQVTDQPGQTVTASNVYFNSCADKRNIIFNNMCWQMIRTTENSGIKMIYNGDVVDGKCESTRAKHKGIVGASGSTTQTLNASYLYGDSFTYDTTNNNFTLTDTTTATWSDSTYEGLIGKFTCKNTTGTCTTLYNVNGYYTNTQGYTSSYTIGDTNCAQIGTSAFNTNYRSPAMVGYMFNKVYNYSSKTISGTNKFGSTFTYANGTYTLTGTTQDLTTLSGSNIASTHYTCWNAEGTCSNISYVYYIISTTGYYIEISNGKSITDALNEMLYETSLNRYNSSIKGIVDSWYRQNMVSKTNMLEDAVYCNARDINNQSTNGWNKDGSLDEYMYFKNNTLNNDLSCVNERDQFTISNNKAKLTYPVSLATHEELYTLTNNNSSTYYSTLTNTGAYWWGLSPSGFNDYGAYVRGVGPDGIVNNYLSVTYAGGVRLVVTLASGAEISEGDGSEASPWIIE